MEYFKNIQIRMSAIDSQMDKVLGAISKKADTLAITNSDKIGNGIGGSSTQMRNTAD